MPQIKFVPDRKTVEVDAGTDLQTVAEREETFLSFGCRNGMCGTCLVTVVSGMRHLNPPTKEEETTLGELGAGINQRLACQLTVSGDIELAY